MPENRSVAAEIQPPASRAERTATPASQAITSHGSSPGAVAVAAPLAAACTGAAGAADVETDAVVCEPSQTNVTSGIAAAAVRARHAAVCRERGLPSHTRVNAKASAIAAPCQMKCTRVQPSRSAQG